MDISPPFESALPCIIHFLRKLLFLLNPETAHHITLASLRLAEKIKLAQLFLNFNNEHPQKIMGLTFKNPVGLAAGLDKNGDYIDALAALGFGFIEIGTITKRPQAGNAKPRLFRLIKEEALINRMGFNNKGVDYLIAKVKSMKYRGILGINIGKNKETPLENAVAEYIDLYRMVAPFASYVTINISSPNTEQLRDLQHGELLQNLLSALKKEQAQFNQYVPLVVKISPDITEEQLKIMGQIILQEKMDGVIATNTTLSRVGVEHSKYADQMGGLSGKPLLNLSNRVIKNLHDILQDQIPIIGCGGIFSAEDANQKLASGAKLVQVYTGLIYQGPSLIKEILNSIDLPA